MAVLVAEQCIVGRNEPMPCLPLSASPCLLFYPVATTDQCLISSLPFSAHNERWLGRAASKPSSSRPSSITCSASWLCMCISRGKFLPVCVFEQELPSVVDISVADACVCVRIITPGYSNCSASFAAGGICGLVLRDTSCCGYFAPLAASRFVSAALCLRAPAQWQL